MTPPESNAPPGAGERSVLLHEHLRGKLCVQSKAPVRTADDLSVVYTPGVARPCEIIARDPERARQLTVQGNAVAVVTDGSAVLGLGAIGPKAALPVMEGKAALFQEFAGIDAWPVCLDVDSADALVATVERIAPVYAGINLEDIAAPRCFEIERRLQGLGIPVFHDDQHGTAIVLLAAILNACRWSGRNIEDLRVVVNGAGAAGIAIARLLRCLGQSPEACSAPRDVIVCDSRGAIHPERENLSGPKREIARQTNREGARGALRDVLRGADVFVGVSQGDVLDEDAVRSMGPDPVILAMANPTPEIMPDRAKAAGASVVGTGRSDFPNQVNNVLAFPGVFRGAIDARASRVTEAMKRAAAEALAAAVEHPSAERILPDPLDGSVAPRVAEAVARAWREHGDVG